MRIIFILLFFVLVINISAQKKVNNRERYLNSYKMYEDAKCPIEHDCIKNYVYFARDREAIHDHPFLNNPRFEGAQIMYSWRQLEPAKDQYDFSIIFDDYNYLKSKGKRLFIQLQDATFSSKYKAVPDFMISEEYDGGQTRQVNNKGKPKGYIAKRWNKKVRERFAYLLSALGRSFDGRIEGINLQETAIGMSSKYDSTFSPIKYVEAIKTNMSALKKAFGKSVAMQYANFMPDERGLKHADKNYLKNIYEYGEKIGVALGAPDLMVKRIEHLNHPFAMMHEAEYTVPLGIAVQDGNYIGQTGTMEVMGDRKNIVPMLYAFAKDFLKVQYIFWSYQKPYFEEDVLPCFISK